MYFRVSQLKRDQLSRFAGWGCRLVRNSPQHVGSTGHQTCRECSHCHHMRQPSDGGEEGTAVTVQNNCRVCRLPLVRAGKCAWMLAIGIVRVCSGFEFTQDEVTMR